MHKIVCECAGETSSPSPLCSCPCDCVQSATAETALSPGTASLQAMPSCVQEQQVAPGQALLLSPHAASSLKGASDPLRPRDTAVGGGAGHAEAREGAGSSAPPAVFSARGARVRQRDAGDVAIASILNVFRLRELAESLVPRDEESGGATDNLAVSEGLFERMEYLLRRCEDDMLLLAVREDVAQWRKKQVRS